MVEVRKIIKGKEYVYSEKSLKYRRKVIKYSKYGKLSKNFNEEAEEKFSEIISQMYNNSEFPLSFEEIKKIEKMNLGYRKIRKKLHKKDWDDVKKRFVANFVFESNALEGNSLTLKNFTEIIFENKIESATDLREVYKAKNSYQVFSYLLTARKELSIDFIIQIHKKLMKNIDDRIGFKKIPNFLLGRKIEFTPPKNVENEMKKLLIWYNSERYNLHPLELAFKFHHKFEMIHPFADGNGRVGRMLLNYILVKEGHFPIILRKNQRNKYLKVLDVADRGNYLVLMRFAIDKAKETYRKFFEIYSEHILN